MNNEQKRSQDNKWKKWGPYLSERQWGTVREDYSEHGEAWDHFPHDHARSRVYQKSNRHACGGRRLRGAVWCEYGGAGTHDVVHVSAAGTVPG